MNSHTLCKVSYNSKIDYSNDNWIASWITKVSELIKSEDELDLNLLNSDKNNLLESIHNKRCDHQNIYNKEILLLENWAIQYKSLAKEYIKDIKPKLPLQWFGKSLSFNVKIKDDPNGTYFMGYKSVGGVEYINYSNGKLEETILTFVDHKILFDKILKFADVIKLYKYDNSIHMNWIQNELVKILK